MCFWFSTRWLPLVPFRLAVVSPWAAFGSLQLLFLACWLPLGSLWLHLASFWLAVRSLWAPLGSLRAHFGAVLPFDTLERFSPLTCLGDGTLCRVGAVFPFNTPEPFSHLTLKSNSAL